MLITPSEWVSKSSSFRTPQGFNRHAPQTDFCASLFRETLRRIASDTLRVVGPCSGGVGSDSCLGWVGALGSALASASFGAESGILGWVLDPRCRSVADAAVRLQLDVS